MSNATNVFEKILHGAIYRLGLPMIEAALIVEFPFLGGKIPRALLHAFLASQIAERIYTVLARAGVFAIVDYETDKERAAAEKAREALWGAISTEAARAAAIQKAKDEFQKRYAELGRLRPA